MRIRNSSFDNFIRATFYDPFVRSIYTVTTFFSAFFFRCGRLCDVCAFVVVNSSEEFEAVPLDDEYEYQSIETYTSPCPCVGQTNELVAWYRTDDPRRIQEAFNLREGDIRVDRLL